jgi:hypothetical protein
MPMRSRFQRGHVRISSVVAEDDTVFHSTPPSFAMRREVNPCSYHIATSLKQIPSNKGNGWQQIFNQSYAFMQK